jgi:hypothetical protein
MIDYSLILSTNYIHNKWVCSGIDYDGINWLDESSKPTKEELDNQWNMVLTSYKKNECKQEAKRRIAVFDWINDDTTTPQLINKQDFYAYRSALRELILNPVENPVWPEIPQEEWDA